MSVLRISLTASMLSAVLIFGGSWSARAGVSCSAAHVQFQHSMLQQIQSLSQKLRQEVLLTPLPVKAIRRAGLALIPLVSSVSQIALRGRPRLRRPFLGGRPTRFGWLMRLALVLRFTGGSTVHPALRRRSIASTNSTVFISFSPYLCAKR